MKNGNFVKLIIVVGSVIFSPFTKRRMAIQIALVFFAFQATAQTSLFVSPDGRGNQFTKKHPGSLAGARDQVRSLAGFMNSDIVVNLCGGTYFQDSVFQLGPEDSGRNGFSVVWQAASGEKPVLSGGKEITGWALFDKEKNIYKTNVGSLKFRQLYVSGRRAVRARTPNMTDSVDKGPYARILSWDNALAALPLSHWFICHGWR